MSGVLRIINIIIIRTNIKKQIPYVFPSRGFNICSNSSLFFKGSPCSHNKQKLRNIRSSFNVCVVKEIKRACICMYERYLSVHEETSHTSQTSHTRRHWCVTTHTHTQTHLHINHFHTVGRYSSKFKNSAIDRRNLMRERERERERKRKREYICVCVCMRA